VTVHQRPVSLSRVTIVSHSRHQRQSLQHHNNARIIYRKHEMAWWKHVDKATSPSPFLTTSKNSTEILKTRHFCQWLHSTTFERNLYIHVLCIRNSILPLPGNQKSKTLCILYSSVYCTIFFITAQTHLAKESNEYYRELHKYTKLANITTKNKIDQCFW